MLITILGDEPHLSPPALVKRSLFNASARPNATLNFTLAYNGFTPISALLVNIRVLVPEREKTVSLHESERERGIEHNGTGCLDDGHTSLHRGVPLVA
jgi:hypothetical protein